MLSARNSYCGVGGQLCRRREWRSWVPSTSCRNTTSAETLRTASRSSWRMKRRLNRVKPLWVFTVKIRRLCTGSACSSGCPALSVFICLLLVARPVGDSVRAAPASTRQVEAEAIHVHLRGPVALRAAYIVEAGQGSGQGGRDFAEAAALGPLEGDEEDIASARLEAVKLQIGLAEGRQFDSGGFIFAAFLAWGLSRGICHRILT